MELGPCRPNRYHKPWEAGVLISNFMQQVRTKRGKATHVIYKDLEPLQAASQSRRPLASPSTGCAHPLWPNS